MIITSIWGRGKEKERLTTLCQPDLPRGQWIQLSRECFRLKRAVDLLRSHAHSLPLLFLPPASLPYLRAVTAINLACHFSQYCSSKHRFYFSFRTAKRVTSIFNSGDSLQSYEYFLLNYLRFALQIIEKKNILKRRL